jgi:hypothetical protein
MHTPKITPNTYGELRAYQAGKYHGRRVGAVPVERVTKAEVAESMVSAGLVDRDDLSPERAAYWWWRGYRVGLHGGPTTKVG